MTDDNADKKPEEKNGDAGSFLENLYGDPLRAETMRTGRHLIIASVVCMAVVLFKVRLQSTSLIPLDFGDHIEVLPMLLSLAVLLLAVSFMLRAATDLFRDREAAVLVTRYLEGERVKAAEASARATDDSIMNGEIEDREGYYEPDPWWEPYYQIKEAADAAVQRAENRIGVRRVPRAIRTIRKYLEIGVPLVLAAIAILLSRSSLTAFAVALVAAFRP